MKPVWVTRTCMPPLADLIPLLEGIWDRRLLTNCGPLHETLERQLEAHLGVPHVSLYANGTIALVAALQVLGRQGEVITTPFSFVATSHAIRLAGCTPVFVDIDPGTMNLDPEQVRRAVTERTVAIMPVHCYGNACDVEAFDQIERDTGVPVIYDAAHAFGVEVNGASVLNHGRMAVLSFHATKVFSTVEGGAVVCRDPADKRRIDMLRNFGFASEEEAPLLGQNAKMSELHAAFGLLHLKQVPEMIAARAARVARYVSGLADIPGITVVEGVRESARNHAYFPIRVGAPYPLARNELHAGLHARGFMSRRYFYPMLDRLSGLGHVPGRLPEAERATAEVLCLPLFPELEYADLDAIVDTIRALATSPDGRG
jgi:dTDP-4-amino-4,6-dideoxygalactose transaminase